MTTDGFPAAPAIGDAFGQCLMRCWRADGRPGVAFEITERDDGFIYVSDVARYLATPERMNVLNRWACEQARGRVLDVGCGAGRHALALARQGYEVVGIDPSPGAIDVATARGVTAFRGSIEAPPPGIGEFDTVLLLGNNLGLLGGTHLAGDVLGQLAALVRPGGRLIGSSMNPSIHTGPDEAAYQARNLERGQLPGHQRIRIRDGRLSSPWFDYLLLSVDELRDLIDGSPWSLIDSASNVAHVAVLSRS